MSDTSPQPPPEIPDHELLSIIGTGGYGDVWLARNIMGDFRAVKVVRRDRFDSPRPFEREFEGIQKFEPISRTHESQLDVLHIGRNGDYFYYVMEVADDVLRGQDIDPEHYAPHTLRSDILERGRLPFDECLRIALSLTTALEHLHSNGLVHRDIKPSNVIFIHDQPKLADIGLVTDLDATMTMVGTEGYLPPEGPGTPSADLYSLGKVLYEISTGLDRTEFPELPTGQHLLEDRSRFAELNEVITKACNTDPSRRYDTATEMREDLLQIQAGGSLIRSRLLEKRVQWLKRAAVIGGILLALVGSGYLYQKQVTEKLKLKTIKADKSAAAAAAANYEIHNQNSLRSMTLGDIQDSSLWSYSASHLAAPGTDEEWLQEYRINALGAMLPEVLDYVDNSSFRGSANLTTSAAKYSSDYLINTSSNIIIGDSLTGSHQSVIPHDKASWKVMEDGSLLGIGLDGRSVLRKDIDSGEPIFSLEFENRFQIVRSSANGERILLSSKLDSNTTNRSLLECYDGQSGLLIWRNELEGELKWIAISSDGERAAFTKIGLQSTQTNSLVLIDGSTGAIVDTSGAIDAETTKFVADGDFLVYESATTKQQHGRSFAVRVADGRIEEPWQLDEELPENTFIIVSARSIYVDTTRVLTENGNNWIIMERGGVIAQYNLRSRRITRTLPKLADDLKEWALSPTERYLAVVDEQRQIWSFDLMRGHRWQKVARLNVDVEDMKFTYSGNRMLISGSDGSVRLLKTVSSTKVGAQLNTIKLAEPIDLHWDRETEHDAFFVGISEPNRAHPTAYTLDLESLKIREPIPTATDVKSISLNTGKNLLALAKRPNGLEIWDLAKQERVYVTTNYPGVSLMRWNSTGDLLAGGTEESELFILKWSSNPTIVFEQSLDHHEGHYQKLDKLLLSAIEWNPEDDYLYANGPGKQILWHPEESRIKHRDSVKSGISQFSPDGQMLYARMDTGFRLLMRSNNFSFEKGVLLGDVSEDFVSCEWSNDSKKLVTIPLSKNAEGRAYIWNISARKDLIQRELNSETHSNQRLLIDEQLNDHVLNHEVQINAVSISPNDRLVASADVGGEIRLWSLASGEFMAVIGRPDGTVGRMSFSPDGDFLLVAMQNGNLIRFAVGMNEAQLATKKAHLQLLSGGMYDARGIFEIATADDLANDLFVLRNQPHYSSNSRTQEFLNWHISEVQQLGFQGDVSAAMFHAEELARAEPNEPTWRELRDRLEASGISPRLASTPKELIDLSLHYNANLHETSLGEMDGSLSIGGRANIAELGAGIHEFDGQKFDIRGIIHLAVNLEHESRQDYFRYTSTVEGIDVDQRAQRVHFIHAAEAPGRLGVNPGTRIGTYTFNYEDGLIARMPIISEENIRDSWTFAPPESEAAKPNQAKRIWTGECEATSIVYPQASLQLFKATWNNPHPEKAIKSIDFQSAERPQAPFLLAITVEP